MFLGPQGLLKKTEIAPIKTHLLDLTNDQLTRALIFLKEMIFFRLSLERLNFHFFWTMQINSSFEIWSGLN